MKLMKITVTGADDKTQIPDIMRFCALYPRIEFGILVTSPWSAGGFGRYPSFQWIERLAQYIDEHIKEEASAVLAAMGLTVSDAFRIMLTRVAREKALPFEPLIPNETTIAAMREARAGNLKSFDSVGALMADLHAED